MATINGATLIARSLKQQGVDYMFGIVGFPVVPIAIAAQREGITFIGMRNEQAASYATQAAGYLLGRPQACLVVSGPGVIHALSGLANAKENNWPMLLIGGASGIDQNGMGGFQEERQVDGDDAVHQVQPRRRAHRAHPVLRRAGGPHGVVRPAGRRLPGHARRHHPRARRGGRGAAWRRRSRRRRAARPPTPTSRPPSPRCKTAERPLVIVGKGMAWSRAEDEVRGFIERTQLPFLDSPMGKGVMPDDHPLSVGAARSLALKDADLVLLLGARLNWIMHFGLPPRFDPNVRVIQLDISPEQLSTNVPTEVGLVGDGQAVMAQLNAALDAEAWQYPGGDAVARGRSPPRSRPTGARSTRWPPTTRCR